MIEEVRRGCESAEPAADEELPLATRHMSSLRARETSAAVRFFSDVGNYFNSSRLHGQAPLFQLHSGAYA